MIMIEIEKSKVEKMSDLAETMLRAGGQMMRCLEDCTDDDSYNERDDRYEEETMRGDRYRREGRGRGYDDGYGERRGRFRRPSRY